MNKSKIKKKRQQKYIELIKYSLRNGYRFLF